MQEDPGILILDSPLPIIKSSIEPASSVDRFTLRDTCPIYDYVYFIDSSSQASPSRTLTTGSEPLNPQAAAKPEGKVEMCPSEKLTKPMTPMAFKSSPPSSMDGPPSPKTPNDRDDVILGKNSGTDSENTTPSKVRSRRGRLPNYKKGQDSVGTTGPDDWDCTICTFKNSNRAFTCQICNTRKGTSTRKPRLNSHIIAQQALAEKNSVNSLTSPPPAFSGNTLPTPTTIVSPNATGSGAIDPVSASTPSSSKRKPAPPVAGLEETPKPKRGPVPKAKHPDQTGKDGLPTKKSAKTRPSSARASFNKNLNLAATSLLLLSKSAADHKTLSPPTTTTTGTPTVGIVSPFICQTTTSTTAALKKHQLYAQRNSPLTLTGSDSGDHVTPSPAGLMGTPEPESPLNSPTGGPSFLATLMMSSLGAAGAQQPPSTLSDAHTDTYPEPPTAPFNPFFSPAASGAYLNFLHSWKESTTPKMAQGRKNSTDKSASAPERSKARPVAQSVIRKVTSNGLVVMSAPPDTSPGGGVINFGGRYPLPPLPNTSTSSHFDYLNQFKTANAPTATTLGIARPLISSLYEDACATRSSSSVIDSEDEMYINQVVGRASSHLPDYWARPDIPKPDFTVDTGPTPKCRKKRWMDRVRANGHRDGEEPGSSEASSPSSAVHEKTTTPLKLDTVGPENGIFTLDLTTVNLSGVKEEFVTPSDVPSESDRSQDATNSHKKNGIIRSCAKYKKGKRSPPAPAQTGPANYSFDSTAPETHVITANGLTIYITDYPLLS